MEHEPPGRPPPGPPEEEAHVDADLEPRCPRCNAPYEPTQEYCLECGLRLVPLPAFYRRVDVWTRDSPVWLWGALAALLAVALIAGAIVAAAAAGDDDEQAAPSAPVPTILTETGLTDPGTLTVDTLPITTDPFTTTTNPFTTTTDPFTTTGFTTTLQTTTTYPTTSTAPTTTSPSGTISWPVGRDGHTVILRSVPVAEGRSAADAAAEDALDAGLPQVGVLNSSDYSSLNPGYYVTFTGIYDTADEAVNAVPRARNAGFALAYARQIAD
jgi:hypothetical protein